MEAEGTVFDHVHYMKGHESEINVLCMGVWSEVNNFGMTLEDALTKYGISKEDYLAHVDEALS